MEPFNILSLFLLPNVPSSYSNFWWSEALKQSINENGSFDLKVLNESNITTDTALCMGRYIPYPTFTQPVEPGYYHLNVQGTSQMFSGFMHVVSEHECFWWATDGSDRILAGFAGDTDLFNNYRNGYTDEIINWVGAINYNDRFDKDLGISHILKPF